MPNVVYVMGDVSHYGAKGMHWGIRKREQSEPHKKGLSAAQKKKLKTAAIVIGSVAAIAAGAYLTKRYLDMNGTKVFKAGSSFQRVAKVMNEDFSKPVYVSYLKGDNRHYATTYAKAYSAPYIKTLQSKQAIKVAGKHEVLKAFAEWGQAGKGTKKELAAAYKRFNSMMISPDIRDQAMRDSFLDLLASKGYSAIHDTNDQAGFTQGLGYGTKSPLILFGVNSAIMTTKIVDLMKGG